MTSETNPPASSTPPTTPRTTPSPWQARHVDDDPAPGGAQLPSEPSEVVVVGAGLTGLTTALLLARAGRSVTVIEARRIGCGTTGGSTAKVSLLQGTRLSEIERRQGEEALRAYVDANREGQAWMIRFCADHDVPMETRDAYTFAWSERGHERVRAEAAAGRAGGLDVDLVTELPLPFDTRGAVRLGDQRQLDPMRLLLALRAEAERHGARVVQDTRVRSVSGRGPVTVRTEHGDVVGGTVVIATGMPILDRGGFFGRMVPARSYGLAYRTDGALIDGMFLSADEPSRSLRDADDGAMLMVGGAGHTTGRGGSTVKRLDDLRSWTDQHFPGLAETHAWSAQDYVPTRALPYAGPVLPGLEHILVAGGYAKWGLTNAVAAALALSGRILGGHQPWAHVLEPWHREHGVVATAGANLEVGVEMVRGWIRPVVSGALTAPAGDAGEVRYDRVGTPTAHSLVDGEERRVSAVCTHLGGIVAWNDAERSWDCPLHGSRFGADGAVLEGPATCGLRPRGR